MSGREKRKLIFGLAGVILLLGAFWLVVSRLDKSVTRTAAEKEQTSSQAQVLEEEQKPVTLFGKSYTTSHEFETYLLMGTDVSGHEGTGEDYQGSMADFLLLVIFDRTGHSYSAIHLDRDTMAEITLLQADGTGMASAELPLCTAHWYGGNPEKSCENTVKAVSELLGGLTIDGYYAIGLEQIADLNHVVGGVTVKLKDDFSKFDPSMKKGKTLHLNDQQACIFLHNRYDVGDGSNQSRMKRQRQYMKALFQKVQEENGEGAGYITSLYQELSRKAVTNLTGKAVSRIAKQITEGENKGVYTLQGKYKVGDTLGDGEEHMEFYADQEYLEELVRRLYQVK